MTEPRKNQRKTPLTPKKRDLDDIPIYTRIGGGRIKKAKIPFDPSENYIPKRRMTMFVPSKSETLPTLRSPKSPLKTRKSSRKSGKNCMFCAKHDVTKPFISCRDCTAIGHLTCIPANNGPIPHENEKNWSCQNCETCLDCYEAGHVLQLYKCRICFSPYHLECQDSKSQYKSKTVRFTCRNCREIIENKSNIEAKRQMDEEITSEAISSNVKLLHEGFQGFHKDELNDQHTNNTKLKPIETAEISATVDKSSKPEKLVNKTTTDVNLSVNNKAHVESFLSREEPVEDPSSWDFDAVYKYFYRYFPRDAHILRDQEIDGKSLLLMKRSDVIGLKLKLGTAINMYAHVLKLQTSKNDITLGWG